MIPEGFQARHRFDVMDWLCQLANSDMVPVALIAVDDVDDVRRVGMAGTPVMTATQLVTLLEECLTHARRRVEIELLRQT